MIDPVRPKRSPPRGQEGGNSVGARSGHFDHGNKQLGGRIALPESGPAHVSVNVPGQTYAASFDQTSCSTWDADIQNTNVWYNNVRALKGHARFSCSDDAGAHVEGDLQFHSCH